MMPTSRRGTATRVLVLLAAFVLTFQPTFLRTASAQSEPSAPESGKVLHNVRASGNEAPVFVDDPMAADPADHNHLIAAGANRNSTPCVGVFTSSDGGTSWSPFCMEHDGSYAPCENPTVVYDLDGVAYAAAAYCFTEEWTEVQTSSDNGQTWTPPVVAVRPAIQNAAAYRSQLKVDTSPESPFSNTVYIATAQIEGGGPEWVVTVSRSTDHGKTWTQVTVKDSQGVPATFANLAIGRDGTLYLAWMACSFDGLTCGGRSAWMMLSKSKDGGKTWSNPVTMATVTLAPDHCDCSFYGAIPRTSTDISDYPAMAIDTSSGKYSGRLYATMYDWTGQYMRTLVIRSDDEGSTWKTALPVPSDTHDQFLAWIAVSQSGKVGVTWLDRAPRDHYVAYQAVSGDGGRTYRAKPLSTAQSVINGYIGWYDGATWDGNTLYGSWAAGKFEHHLEVGWYSRS